MAVKAGMLNLNIKDKHALYLYYMPFIKNGGLFVPTPKKFDLGDDVFLLLTLPNDTERYPVAGKVVWMAPRIAIGHREPGIGMQFHGVEAQGVLRKIESLLGGALNAERPTVTM